MPVGLTCTEKCCFSLVPRYYGLSLLGTLNLSLPLHPPPRVSVVTAVNCSWVSYFQPRPQGFSPPICFREKPWERGTRLSHFLWT